MKIKIIDPLSIPEKDLPLIMLTDNMMSFISLKIKGHSKGFYSHIGIIANKGKFASQLNTFREVDIADYVKKRYRLKLYKIIGTEKQKRKITRLVNRHLALPWYERFYDYVGILGHKIGLRRFNIPFLHYCSEFVGYALKGFYNFKSHRTPAEMNEVMGKVVKKFKYYGHYFVD